jgi:hypothetical protein
MRDLVNDFRRPLSQSGSMLAPNERNTAPVELGTGWVDAPQLRPSPGVDLVDKLCQAQDRRDRAEKMKVEIDMHAYAMQRAAEREVDEEQKRYKEENPIAAALYENPDK